MKKPIWGRVTGMAIGLGIIVGVATDNVAIGIGAAITIAVILIWWGTRTSE